MAATTTRLCVKNLPKHCSEERLKQLFASQGEVTDVKLQRTRDGRSRQFGFVGFRTPEEAEKVLKYFNKSFVDASRIVVEYARGVKAEGGAPRPWSKHSQGSSAHAKATAATTANGDAALGRDDGKKNKKKNKKGAEAEGEEGGDEFKEFMAVMQPRSKSRIWSNDDRDDVTKRGATSAPQPTNNGGKVSRKSAPTIIKGADQDADNEDDDDDELYVDHDAERNERTKVRDNDAANANDDETAKDAMVVDEAVSDLDYLKSRMTKQFEDDDDDDDDGDQDDDVIDEDDDDDGAGADEDDVKGVGDVSDGDGDAGPTADGDDDDEDDDAQHAMDSDGSAQHADAHHARDDVDESDDERRKSHSHAGPSHAVDVVDAAEEEAIAGTGRLFVRNLPYTATESDLRQLFGEYGDVSEVHVVLDRNTKKSKGLAFVSFVDPQHAVAAHAALDGTIFQGRLMHILAAKKQPTVEVEETARDGEAKGASSSYKREQDAKRKASAGDRATWNTVFMRQDTVAEAVAAHFGISKRELLDAHGSSDLAVRMALGETHVIAQTKKSLGDAGVNIDAMEAAAAASGKASPQVSIARSSNVLLVKNLPYATTEEELHEMFSKCGVLARVVLPSTRALALVEFVEPSDARRAFKSLAYRRFHHVPLYLEWAPKDIFNTPAPAPAAPAPASTAQATGTASGTTKGASAAVAGLAAAEAADDDIEVLSIYVKNLSFNTTDESFRKHFDKLVSSVGGQLHATKVARKKSAAGKLLSMGFGFVECDSADTAKAIVRSHQGTVLDGHTLVLQLSAHGGGGARSAAAATRVTSAKADGATAKLLVRNVAFEATRKDLLNVFKPFGAVKQCRLPKKFDGSHRGFAFVDFTTKQEARAAVEAVGGVHLYGRRLVIEFAKEEEGLDELRAKTAAKSRAEDEDGGGRANKRLKLG